MASEIKNPSERSSELQLVKEAKPTSHSLVSNFTTPLPRCLKQCQQRFIHEPRCPAKCKRATGHGGHCDCLQKHIPIHPRNSSSVLKNYDWSANGLLNVLEFAGPNNEFTCIPCGPPQDLNWPELCICRAGGTASCLFPTGGRSLYCARCGPNVYCACGCGSCDPSASYSETDAISKIAGPESPAHTTSLSSTLQQAAGVKYSMPWLPVPVPPPFKFGPNPMTVLFDQMHVRTRLTSGHIGLLVDPGAFDNLCGAHWLLMLCRIAGEQGFSETWHELDRALGIEGVGKQAQVVTHGVKVPIAMDACSGVTSYNTSVVQDSYIPGLLGFA
jgi:hypothetical protein